MSYKLQYAMLLPVEGAIDADGVGLGKDAFAAALRNMADLIEEEVFPLKDVFGTPVDSRIEDRWVLRSIDEPGVIRTSDASWARTTSATFDIKDSLPSEVIYNQIWNRKASLWMRPENIDQEPVLASTLKLDDPDSALNKLDLADWLAWVGEDEVGNGIRAGWDFSSAIEDAFSPYPDERNGRVNPLKDDPNLQNAAFFFVYPLEDMALVILPENQEHARSYIKDLYPGLLENIENDSMEP